MIDFDLGNSRRVRVWREPLAEAAYRSRDHFVHRVAADTRPTRASEGYGLVELVAPKGARVDYGLLGACFTPVADATDLLVTVEYVITEVGVGPEFDSSLAILPEHPVVGLPRELAGSVMKGAVDELASDGIGRGELRFAHAAHGAIGSSDRVFSMLARLVVVTIREAANGEGLRRLLTAAAS